MPKPKTKIGPLETVATEVRMGHWEFTVGVVKDDNGENPRPRYSWQYESGRPGLNLYLAGVPILYAKSLDLAIMYAHGYDAGVARERRLAAQEG